MGAGSGSLRQRAGRDRRLQAAEPSPLKGDGIPLDQPPSAGTLRLRVEKPSRHRLGMRLRHDPFRSSPTSHGVGPPALFRVSTQVWTSGATPSMGAGAHGRSGISGSGCEVSPEGVLETPPGAPQGPWHGSCSPLTMNLKARSPWAPVSRMRRRDRLDGRNRSAGGNRRRFQGGG